MDKQEKRWFTANIILWPIIICMIGLAVSITSLYFIGVFIAFSLLIREMYKIMND